MKETKALKFLSMWWWGEGARLDLSSAQNRAAHHRSKLFLRPPAFILAPLTLYYLIGFGLCYQ